MFGNCSGYTLWICKMVWPITYHIHVQTEVVSSVFNGIWYDLIKVNPCNWHSRLAMRLKNQPLKCFKSHFRTSCFHGAMFSANAVCTIPQAYLIKWSFSLENLVTSACLWIMIDSLVYDMCEEMLEENQRVWKVKPMVSTLQFLD